MTKRVIITGASVGIGLAAAKRFLDEGFEVFNLARRTCPLAGVHSIYCDLADSNSLQEALDTLCDKVADSNAICVIHNASQMLKDATQGCDSDALRRVLETNIVAINSLNQRLIPLMAEGSSLLYVGSTLSEKAVPNSFSYVVSKHAQMGIMRASCQDLMGSGIHTALICPGFTDTEMLRTHIGNDPEVAAAIASLNSYNRLLEPEEIAQLLYFCHSNAAINGAVMHANLGQKES